MLSLDGHAVARVRFTTSSLWEIGLSARILRKAVPGPVHGPWVRATRAAVDAEVLSRVTALTAGESFIADFLTPTGAQPLTDGIDSELAHLHELDPVLIGRDLDHLARANHAQTSPGHVWVRQLAGLSTGRVVDEIDDTLRTYWAGAIEPHWGRYLRLVDEDTTQQARTTSRDGVGAMLNSLHPRVRFTGSSLDIAGACEASVELADASQGILLVPSAFAWPDVEVQPNAPYQPAIAYGVRGLGTLWFSDDEIADHLGALLGAGRARVLAALVAPATTQELAHDLSLAPSTVSAHLQALTASRLTAPTREGRSVLYRLTDLGRSLLAGR